MEFKNRKLITLVALGLSLQYANAFATQNSVSSQFNGWNEFSYVTDTNNLNSDGKPDGVIGPGGGGQAFDTEYLFYKYDANSNNLSIGLQTGFNIETGEIEYNNEHAYAGDLALSFDNDTKLGDRNDYEYAVDFGLFTMDKDGNTVESTETGAIQDSGLDNQGLYAVHEWSDKIDENDSSPFAMKKGEVGGYIRDLLLNEAGFDGSTAIAAGGVGSYYRIVTFNLDSIVTAGEAFTVDAHWTMSTGNDNINGTTTIAANTTTDIPEPSALALFAIGALGLGFSGYRRRKRL